MNQSIKALEEYEKLTEFFRSEAGYAFGVEGDHRGWTPAETAIHFMTMLSADSEMRLIETNIKQFRHNMNTMLDRTQRRFNEVFTEDAGKTD